MIANLKVGKTIKALANLITPFAPWNPFAPWGVSPQAKRPPSPPSPFTPRNRPFSAIKLLFIKII